MRYVKLCTVLFFTLMIGSCSSEQSLQEYFVSNAENPNFISFDVPASLLNLEKVELTQDQKEAVSSLKKLNVLAFTKNDANTAEFEAEKQKVKAILKNAAYSELMTMNTSFGKATIQVKGDDDTLDELIIYGNNTDKGFVLIRVLGDNMNPASLMQAIQAMQNSDMNIDGLTQLGNLFKG